MFENISPELELKFAQKTDEYYEFAALLLGVKKPSTLEEGMEFRKKVFPSGWGNISDFEKMVELIDKALKKGMLVVDLPEAPKYAAFEGVKYFRD